MRILKSEGRFQWAWAWAAVLLLGACATSAHAAEGDVTVEGPTPATVAAGSCFTLTYSVDVGATPVKLSGTRLRLIASEPGKVELKAIDVTDAMLPDPSAWSVATIQPPPATPTQFDANGRISIQAASSSSQLGTGLRKLLAVEVCVKPGASAGNVQLSLEFRDPLAMLTGASQSVDLEVNPNPATFSINVSTGPPSCTVPNVVGQSQSAATAAITAANLTVGTVTQSSSATVPSGLVISTTPAGGASVACNSAVNLVVSTGPGSTSPALTVTPDSATAPAAGATRSFTVANTGGGTLNWSVSSGCNWVTVSPANGTNGGTVQAVVQANTTNQQRQCTLTFTSSGATDSPKTVTITQSAAGALSVTPDSRSVGAAAGSTTFAVETAGAWTAASNQGWATVSPASSSGNGTVTVTYAANTGAARTATITVTAPGATGSPKTVTVSQAAPTPVLSVSPDSATAPAAGTTRSFTVANTGGGTLNWSVSSGCNWVTVSPANGTNGGTVQAVVQANTTNQQRQCTLTFTASGATGSPKTVTITQSAAGALSVTPDSRSVGAASGSTTFAVETAGAWTAASNQGWATVSPTSSSGNGTVTVAYAANTGAARTATITVTAPGATGSPKTVTVTQAAPTPVLSVSPDSATAPAAGTTRSFTVANTGGGTLNWSVSSGCNWVTVSPASGTNGGTVQATVQANTTNQQRQCTLTFTASGATGSPKTVTITQAPAGALTVTPDSRSVGAAAGSTTFAVETAGGWTASSNQGWATVSSTTGHGNGIGTVTVAYAANTGAARTATITVTPSGGGASATATLTQGPACPAELPQPDFWVSSFEGEAGIQIDWDFVPSARGYRIYRALGSSNLGDATLIATLVSEASSYFDSDVQGGYDEYEFIPSCGLLPGCGGVAGDFLGRVYGPYYVYWVQAVDDACGVESPLDNSSGGSSWKESSNRTVNADAGVLLLALLAMVYLARRYGRPEQAADK